MYLKVHPTVPEDESSLCYTCRFATVITGRNPHDQIVECLRLYGSDSRVRFAHPLLASVCYQQAPIWRRRAEWPSTPSTPTASRESDAGSGTAEVPISTLSGRGPVRASR